MLITGERSVLWVLCLLAGIMGIIGAVVFKGRHVPDELERRFHV